MRKVDDGRVNLNLSLSGKLKRAVKAYPLPKGITHSDIFRWLFKAALAERKGVSDETFVKEMDEDEKGRIVHEWIRSRIAAYMK